MAKCDACGNDYDGAFKVATAAGKSYTFDSFECAIFTLAPACEHCNVRMTVSAQPGAGAAGGGGGGAGDVRR